MSQERLNQLKTAIEKGKELRTRALSRKEILEQQEKELVEEIRKLGVDPERIEAEIQKLQVEQEKLLKEIERLIPSDLLK
ncbi:hypothetical protein BEP19_16540 [Ammoniphilus oxalaticus]|uniref:Uncharacterized protein n=1 Tax=Ammoniphilus oxalaticus TaxID=66863 RepID=A0A419SQL8_9BACL|nr:hypothetical protein [Ammoniphilus oxalaticus]RKD26804.1 hypothetical protein BEP19_16540 [Ammoniphilus oxalaticus]